MYLTGIKSNVDTYKFHLKTLQKRHSGKKNLVSCCAALEMDGFQKGEKRESIYNDVAMPEKHNAPSEK